MIELIKVNRFMVGYLISLLLMVVGSGMILIAGMS